MVFNYGWKYTRKKKAVDKNDLSRKSTTAAPITPTDILAIGLGIESYKNDSMLYNLMQNMEIK